MNQRTLASETTVSGTSLFRAEPCKCTIAPAPADSGITFIVDGIPIPAHSRNLSDATAHPAFADIPPRCTALENAGSHVWTVEHVLSALAGLAVDNAVVTLDAHELPIFDGSAQTFADAITNAGTKELDAPRRWITIDRPIRVERGDAFIEITPSDTPGYAYELAYPEPTPIAPATVEWDLDPVDYTDRVAPARTFSLKQEADLMQRAGLFTHLSTKDMLVFGPDGPINNVLRHEHECALHKLLDLIGDLSLAGGPIKGRVHAHKSGHTLAHEATRALAAAQ